jgi:uncharacterized protein YndB with AHSA1/START domain
MTEPSNNSGSPWHDWPIDREIVFGRVIDAPRDLVFAAWTDPKQIESWFGPEGMRIETKEILLQQGGIWRFDMIAPDGSRYKNRMAFLRIESPFLLEIEHGPDEDNSKSKFRMLVTFDEQGDGKTVLTLRQMHPSKEQRQETIGFGAVEYGGQTLEKLARHIAAAPRD